MKLNIDKSGIDYVNYDEGIRIADRRPCLSVDLIYQCINSTIFREVEVGLEDVRAADSILIRYDFERDGWSILQASIFSWDADDKVCDPDWQEVAFIEVWARRTEDEL